VASQSANDKGIPDGQLRPSTTWGEYNNLVFMVKQMLGKIQTATLVRIESCTNSGGVSPVGFVDVTPLVNQLDGDGKPTPQPKVFNVPYLRVQGGGNGIILDPQPGDVGVCVFASRDISKIKSTKKQGNPGSFRQFSFSDGLYLGGMLNGAPTQYVQFDSSGITIYSPNAITLKAPNIKLDAQTVTVNASASTTITTPTFTVNGNTVLNGPLTQGMGSGGGSATMQGPLSVVNDVTAQGTSVHTHIHGGVTPGSGNTGAPA